MEGVVEVVLPAAASTPISGGLAQTDLHDGDDAEAEGRNTPDEGELRQQQEEC